MKTVSQKMIIIVIVICIICIIICSINFANMREEILRDNALYTAPNNTNIETFERKEELEKDQLHQTLYLIGLIVSIAIMVICFILLPSINRKARGEMRKSIKSELHELKSLLDDGIITENEFNQKKKQLLGL